MAGNQLSGSDERLFLAWTGTDLPHHLNFAAGFAPGSEGTYEKFVYDGSDPWGVGPQSSLTGPALASNPVEFDTTLAYIGDGGDGRVFVLSSGPNPTTRRRSTSRSTPRTGGAQHRYAGPSCAPFVPHVAGVDGY